MPSRQMQSSMAVRRSCLEPDVLRSTMSKTDLASVMPGHGIPSVIRQSSGRTATKGPGAWAHVASVTSPNR
eukprot:10281305-Lingulodinium_polyedra.AAC.1